MTRYSTFASDNARNISAKFRFIEGLGVEDPCGFRDLPLKIEPLRRRHPEHVFIDRRLFAELVLANGDVPTLTHPSMIPEPENGHSFRYLSPTHAASSAVSASPIFAAASTCRGLRWPSST